MPEPFIFDFTDFSTTFGSELGVLTQAEVEAKLNLVKFLYCGLWNLEEPLRKELIYLALMHQITLDQNALIKQGGKIKTIKNRQDSVTYAVTESRNSGGLNNLELTFYGQLLQSRLDLLSVGGFVVVGNDLGDFSGGDASWEY